MVATMAGKAGNAGKARNPYHFRGSSQYGWNLIPYALFVPYPFHVTLFVESFVGRKFRDFANFFVDSDS